MKSNRGLIVAAVALVVTGLSGAASLLAHVDPATLPAVPGTPTPVSLLLARQVQIPNCADQDDDDDRDEAKTGKPDTDDIELQCGDQNDDDDEIEDDAPGKHHEREKSHQKHESAPPAVSKKVSVK